MILGVQRLETIAVSMSGGYRASSFIDMCKMRKVIRHPNSVIQHSSYSIHRLLGAPAATTAILIVFSSCVS